jgi:hypothetical protein
MIASGARIVLGTDTGLPPATPSAPAITTSWRWYSSLPPADAIVAARRARRAARDRRHGDARRRQERRLVVLDANPLDDIHNTRRSPASTCAAACSTVMAAGEVAGQIRRGVTGPGAGGFADPRSEAAAAERALGYYDPSVKPVLHGVRRHGPGRDDDRARRRGCGRRVKEDEIPESLKMVERTSPSADRAHPMTGPIFVDGAEAGDVLEVRLVGFEFLHPQGSAVICSGTCRRVPVRKFHLVRFADERAGTASFAPA